MKNKLTKAYSERGADMGRRNNIPDANEPVKLSLVKLKWYDGDYDEGGAYWGYTKGTNIYWAHGNSLCPSEYDASPLKFKDIDIFVRAVSRDDAKKQVRESMPRASFYR